MSTLRFMPLLLIAVLSAPAASAAEATPERVAVSPVTVTTARTVVKINAASCSTPVRYTVEPGPLPEGGSYDVTARLKDGRGRSFGSDETVLEEGTTYRGSIIPRCTKKLTSGTYTVSVKVLVNDYYLDPVETREGSAKVRLKVTRPATTRLVVKKTPYGSAGWQWTGRLTSREKPVGGQRIDLWWDLPGWQNYDVPKRTNRNGIVHWVSNPDGALPGINFQLRFRGTPNYAPSRSTIFNLAPR